MYCGTGHRIFVLQITDFPSTLVTLRADIVIEMNNMGIPKSSLTQMCPRTGFLDERITLGLRSPSF
ncbi:hypothetical protein PILCRDRAFT_819337 [Piloderma croceum F 1598]|uniref:Uncharacterized protein n=1 Tax=Piloderma croceum (strain F 1598) TaxID=765440 RepID=A0A0C3C2D7_PILCF|nr:hypothetical protein PILCRDRAFT_819337 [Piloderma croceum F 1598]